MWKKIWNGHILKVQVNILARELYLEFVPMDLDSDETTRGIGTAVLHRISIRIIWAEWFGLGSHFLKSAHIYRKVLFFQNMMSMFPGTGPQNEFFPKRTPAATLVGPSVFPDSQFISDWLVLQYFQIHELYQNGWIFNISRSPVN